MFSAGVRVGSRFFSKLMELGVVFFKIDGVGSRFFQN